MRRREQGREPKNSTCISRWVWESNPGHIDGRRELPSLRHRSSHSLGLAKGDEGFPLFMSYFHYPSASQLPKKWRQTPVGEDPNRNHFTSIIQTFQRINNIPWTWVWYVPHVLQRWMLFEFGWLLQSAFLLSEPSVPFLDSTVISFVSHSEDLKEKKPELCLSKKRLSWCPSSLLDSITTFSSVQNSTF